MEIISDSVVDVAYTMYDMFLWLWSIVRAFLLLQYPHVREIAFFSNAINGTLGAYAAMSGQPVYWLHSLVASALSAFGGGFVAPLLIGKSAAPFNNDFLLFATIISWYAIFNLKAGSVLSHPVVKAIWSVFLGLFRTHAVVNIVTVANATLSPSVYYPVPLFGPIICGTVLGSMGLFLPFTKGYSPIAKSSPWPLQAAYYTAFFYHTMVNDQAGFIGQSMRMLLGIYTKDQVILIIAIVQIVHLELQIFLSSDVNLFTPIHKVCYVIFQVPGPILQYSMTQNEKEHVGWSDVARKRLHMLLEVSRVLVVLSVVFIHIYFAVPRTYFPTYAIMKVGQKEGGLGFDLGAMRKGGRISWAHLAGGVRKSDQEFNFTLTRNDYEDLLAYSFPVGDSIASCQYFNTHSLPLFQRPCTPYVATLTSFSLPSANNGRKQPAFNTTSYILSVYDDVLVHKYSLSHGLSGLSTLSSHSPSRVYSIFNTTSASALGSGKNEVLLSVLSDGQIVLWTNTNSTSNTIVYSYAQNKEVKRAGEGVEGYYGLGVMKGELVMLGGEKKAIEKGKEKTKKDSSEL